MEIREVLNEYDFPGDDTPIIQGSALKALEDPDGEWGDKIMELMDAVDTWIPTPERATDKPFLMPVEDVFSITGRGTVATGRVERGTLHVSDEVEIIGIHDDVKKTVVTGIEMFRKLLISSTVISTLSPGIHISIPAGSSQTPVTSVVLNLTKLKSSVSMMMLRRLL